MKNTFPITRTVLVEKKINLTSKVQVIQFLKQELSACSVYKYKTEDTFFYTKNNFTFLEIQTSYSYCAYLNLEMDFAIGHEVIQNDSDMQKEIKNFIFKDLFEIKNYLDYSIYFGECSPFGFVVSSSKKIA